MRLIALALTPPLWRGSTWAAFRAGAAGGDRLRVPVPAHAGRLDAGDRRGSAAIARVNGSLEELLWRGGFLDVLAKDWLLGYVHPSAGFALWRFDALAILVHDTSRM